MYFSDFSFLSAQNDRVFKTREVLFGRFEISPSPHTHVHTKNLDPPHDNVNFTPRGGGARGVGDWKLWAIDFQCLIYFARDDAIDAWCILGVGYKLKEWYSLDEKRKRVLFSDHFSVKFAIGVSMKLLSEKQCKYDN